MLSKNQYDGLRPNQKESSEDVEMHLDRIASFETRPLAHLREPPRKWGLGCQFRRIHRRIPNQAS